ncbi:DASH family cryptochrome [Enterovibrio norvegicus]|uniref:DASH family cryptochrome n=1 Tax=Enterovibrio norvegicus TaxID=188144 RepID=UPI00352F45AB
MNKAVYWFTHDLRLQDNPTVSELLRKNDEVAFVFVIDPRWFEQRNHHQKMMGSHRWRFLCESLLALDETLRLHGQHLIVLEGDPVEQLKSVLIEHRINTLGCAKQTGWFERTQLARLGVDIPRLNIVSQWNSTLFDEAQFSIMGDVFSSFSRFRKRIETAHFLPLEPCKIWLETLPPPALESTHSLHTQLSRYGVLSSYISQRGHENGYAQDFYGGEQAALEHLNNYFSSRAPLSYKQTRNALDDWESSTKFSPFLSLGTVSPRQVWQQLRRYEAEFGSNESTYWIGFELLWREYFQWLSIKQGVTLYAFKGNASTAPLTSHYAERLMKWTKGETPFPLVNACMNQLNKTGYLSNRGRQIVASCLVNELSVDWRFGAAYFQQQLIDFDVASNWGNWQYIAGVGADPRGGRHFNIDKQTEMYDPDGEYIRRWNGQQGARALDSVDAADWPIYDM